MFETQRNLLLGSVGKKLLLRILKDDSGSRADLPCRDTGHGAAVDQDPAGYFSMEYFGKTSNQTTRQGAFPGSALAGDANKLACGRRKTYCIEGGDFTSRVTAGQTLDFHNRFSHYHKMTDTPDKINYTQVDKQTHVIYDCVKALAGNALSQKD